MTLPTNETEANALDTDGDGTLTIADSPFSPYYPGDDYIDWVGLSVYYKGPNSQNINVLQPTGYCYGALFNYNFNTGQSAADPWYTNYCEAKPHVACMFAESGAAYHDMISGDQGVSDLALKQQWWEDCLVGDVARAISFLYRRISGSWLCSSFFLAIASITALRCVPVNVPRTDQHNTPARLPKTQTHDAIRIWKERNGFWNFWSSWL
jgi:hypothetical protein